MWSIRGAFCMSRYKKQSSPLLCYLYWPARSSNYFDRNDYHIYFLLLLNVHNVMEVTGLKLQSPNTRQLWSTSVSKYSIENVAWKLGCYQRGGGWGSIPLLLPFKFRFSKATPKGRISTQPIGPKSAIPSAFPLILISGGALPKHWSGQQELSDTQAVVCVLTLHGLVLCFRHFRIIQSC